ncbi:MAG: hypothetical protein HY735_03650 [Verrucomicrobia bacterium]|nr:hypothetical protein [Verrucomicrobiota bacterium]
MPTLMPNDTGALFRASAEKFDSRSLLLDRFVYDHPKMDEARRLHFARVCEDSFKAGRFEFLLKLRATWEKERNTARKPEERQKFEEFLEDTAPLARRTADIGPAEALKPVSSHQALLSSIADAGLLYAQLQSRLMVNMTGGVMENAGLCLDRFGLPYIPGSAVKGCARRGALAALREWCESGQKPGATEQDKDNLFKAACEPFSTPAEMLAAIACVFGWCEQDWKDESDFAWACSGNPTDIWRVAAEKLCSEFGWKVPKEKQPTPWKALPNFGGSVSFLPACSVDVKGVKGLPLDPPELGKLELDVVTVHHQAYYNEPDRNKKPHEWEEWNRKWSTAPDIEEPVPNVFPAVAPGHIFAFALAPLRGGDAKLVQLARQWLKTGLETFGLGAKTNAGYGWFADVTDAMRALQDAEKEARAEKARQAKEKADREAARATLQPDLALIEKLGAMKEPDLRGQINPFATEERFWAQQDERFQFTLFHFLLVTAPDLFAADRANSKSKIAKAIANLAAKFPRVAPPKAP